MARTSRLVLLLLLLLTLAIPAHGQSGTDATEPEPESDVYISVPDDEDVAIAVLLEPGETEAAKLASLVDKLEAAVRSDPGDFAALVRLGIALQKQGQHDRARTHLAQAAALEPRADAVKLLMVRSVVAEGAIPIPPESGTTSAQYVPDEADVRIDALVEPGDTDEQRLRSLTGKLEAKIKADPADFETRVKLAIALQLQSRHQDARPHLDEALTAEPGAKGVYSLLARTLAAVEPGLKVYVNGRPARLDVPPVLVQGRTLLPVRSVAEQLGAQVDWNADTFTATVTLGPNTVQVTRDSTRALVNGLAVTLDVPATIMDGRTMLPLRFVGEGLNKLVEYYPGDQSGSALIAVRNK